MSPLHIGPCYLGNPSISVLVMGWDGRAYKFPDHYYCPLAHPIDHSGDLQLLMCLYQLIENLLIPSQCCANLNGRNYRAIHQPLRRTTQLHADPLRSGPVRRGDQLKVMTYSCFWFFCSLGNTTTVLPLPDKGQLIKDSNWWGRQRRQVGWRRAREDEDKQTGTI